MSSPFVTWEWGRTIMCNGFWWCLVRYGLLPGDSHACLCNHGNIQMDQDCCLYGIIRDWHFPKVSYLPRWFRLKGTPPTWKKSWKIQLRKCVMLHLNLNLRCMFHELTGILFSMGCIKMVSPFETVDLKGNLGWIGQFYVEWFYWAITAFSAWVHLELSPLYY